MKNEDKAIAILSHMRKGRCKEIAIVMIGSDDFYSHVDFKMSPSKFHKAKYKLSLLGFIFEMKLGSKSKPQQIRLVDFDETARERNLKIRYEGKPETVNKLWNVALSIKQAGISRHKRGI